jgi:hypothetical protein
MQKHGEWYQRLGELLEDVAARLPKISVYGFEIGDRSDTWDPSNPEETKAAQDTFASLKQKGYNTFYVGPGGDKSELMRRFDPTAGNMISSIAAGGPAPVGDHFEPSLASGLGSNPRDIAKGLAKKIARLETAASSYADVPDDSIVASEVPPDEVPGAIESEAELGINKEGIWRVSMKKAEPGKPEQSEFVFYMTVVPEAMLSSKQKPLREDEASLFEEMRANMVSELVSAARARPAKIRMRPKKEKLKAWSPFKSAAPPVPEKPKMADVAKARQPKPEVKPKPAVSKPPKPWSGSSNFAGGL